MPRPDVVGTSHLGHASVRELSSATVNPFAAGCLGKEQGRGSACDALTAFCDAYDRWIETSLAARLNEFEGELHRGAEANLTRCRNTLARMRRGV
jgi:hypothetical protein